MNNRKTEAHPLIAGIFLTHAYIKGMFFKKHNFLKHLCFLAREVIL